MYTAAARARRPGAPAASSTRGSVGRRHRSGSHPGRRAAPRPAGTRPRRPPATTPQLADRRVLGEEGDVDRAQGHHQRGDCEPTAQSPGESAATGRSRGGGVGGAPARARPWPDWRSRTTPAASRAGNHSAEAIWWLASPLGGGHERHRQQRDAQQQGAGEQRDVRGAAATMPGRSGRSRARVRRAPRTTTAHNQGAAPDHRPEATRPRPGRGGRRAPGSEARWRALPGRRRTASGVRVFFKPRSAPVAAEDEHGGESEG